VDHICCTFTPVYCEHGLLQASGIFAILTIFQRLLDGLTKPNRVEPP
jgi:hypothetical protein